MLLIYVNISLHFQDYVTVNEFPLQLFKGSIFAAHEGNQMMLHYSLRQQRLTGLLLCPSLHTAVLLKHPRPLKTV